MPDDRLLTKMPGPLGYSSALDRMGTTAAPLLAGFAFTLIGLVLVNASGVGDPEVALLLLLIAALLLINAVQLAFQARRFYIEPEQYVALLEISDLEPEGSISSSELQKQYAEWLPEHVKFLGWARIFYNSGIVLLLAGVSAALVPSGPLSRVSDLRLAAAALSAAGAATEFVFGVVPAAIDAVRLRHSGPDGGSGVPEIAVRGPVNQAVVPPSGDAATDPAAAATPAAESAAAAVKAPAQPPTACAAPATCTGPVMPKWIFWLEFAWLLLLIAIFVVYINSSSMRQALPTRLGTSIPIAVPWFGALGGCLISHTGIFAYNRSWDPSYNYWHAIRPLVGAITGGLGCVLLLITTQASTTGNVHVEGTFYDGVAFVFGFAEAAFRSLVSRVTSVLLKPGS